MPILKPRKKKPRALWYVYLLRCGDGSLYCGITNALKERVQKHQAGRGAKYTRSHLPVRLVYKERAKTKGAALKREYALKKLSRAAKEALVMKNTGGQAARGTRSPLG